MGPRMSLQEHQQRVKGAKMNSLHLPSRALNPHPSLWFRPSTTAHKALHGLACVPFPPLTHHHPLASLAPFLFSPTPTPGPLHWLLMLLIKLCSYICLVFSHSSGIDSGAAFTERCSLTLLSKHESLSHHLLSLPLVPTTVSNHYAHFLTCSFILCPLLGAPGKHIFCILPGPQDLKHGICTQKLLNTCLLDK